MTRVCRIGHFGCTHELEDNKYGESPMARYFADANKFGANMFVHSGDYEGSKMPTDDEGPSYREKLIQGLPNHYPEAVYPGAGNHCRGPLGGKASLDWFRKWVDPMSENPETSGNDPKYRPYPIIDGDAFAYEIGVGENVSVFVLSDTARPDTPGRTNRDGDPGGVIQPDTYQWMKDKMLSYKDTDRIVMVFSHYGVYETTAATGKWEGGTYKDGVYSGRFHGAGSSNGEHSSYLAYVGEDASEPPFVKFFEENPGICHTWGHVHGHIMSGSKIGGKFLIEQKYGCTFVNSGALTQHHHGRAQHINPKSRFWDLQDGSSELRLHAYMHKTVSHGGFHYPRGRFSTKTINLPHKVRL